MRTIIVSFLNRTRVFLYRFRKAHFSLIEALLYIGSKFECPICGWHFRKMKPFKRSYYIQGQLVDHYTKNSLCPRCNHDIRHRFVFMFLKSNTNILKSKIKLLHFAPESFLVKFFKKQRNIEYTPCDIDPLIYPGSIKVDITDMQFQDATFDAIILLHVLNFIRDDTKAITELYRVLKPDGWAVLTVPIYGNKTVEDTQLDHADRKKMYGCSDHVRMYGLDLKDKLSNAGFLTKVPSFEDVPGKYIDRNVSSPHVQSDRYLFYCVKKV